MRVAIIVFAVTIVIGGARTAVSAQSFVDPATGHTLEQLTTLGMAQSPEILAAGARIDVARGHLQQAALRPNPSVTASRREEPAGSDDQTAVSFELPLDLFRREGRVNTAIAEVSVAQLAAADSGRLLAAAIRERAGAALLADRLLAVTDQLLGIHRRTRDLLAARVREGAAPPIDHDVADVEVRRLEAERAHRAAALDASILELKALVGLDPALPLTLRDDLEQQVRAEAASRPPVPEQPADVAARRSDVLEAAARAGVAAARADQLRREAKFDLGVYGTYMRMDAGFPQSGFGAGGALERIRGRFHYLEFGGMVTLPLFNRNQGAIAAAESERRAADLTRQSRELTARAELAAAAVHDRHAVDALERYREARDLARRNVDVVCESYQLGRTTLFEVFSGQRRLLDIEIAYAEALARAFEARTALIRASGVRP